MPLYMDIHHKVEGLTADAVMHAHEAQRKGWLLSQKEGMPPFSLCFMPNSDLLVITPCFVLSNKQSNEYRFKEKQGRQGSIS